MNPVCKYVRNGTWAHWLVVGLLTVASFVFCYYGVFGYKLHIRKTECVALVVLAPLLGVYLLRLLNRENAAHIFTAYLKACFLCALPMLLYVLLSQFVGPWIVMFSNDGPYGIMESEQVSSFVYATNNWQSCFMAWLGMEFFFVFLLTMFTGEL